MLHLILALVIAALILWAITQFPLDATLVKLIRVVVIVVCVLYIIVFFFGGAGGFAGLSTGGPCRV